MKIKKGDYIETPRFMKVKIAEVMGRTQAAEKSYNEPTGYESCDYEIYGKSTGENRMEFAAIRKNTTNAEAYVIDLSEVEDAIYRILQAVPEGKTKKAIAKREELEFIASQAIATLDCMKNDCIVQE